MEHSDFLPSFPRRFVSFASRYRRCALGFAPADARRSAHEPGVVYRTPQNRFINGDDRISQVPGGPRYERALLFDPGETSALGHCRASVLSSALLTASTPATTTISRLYPTARPFAVYASQGELPQPPRKTRFRMAGLPFRAGLVTRWVPAKGFRSSHPPFPGFAWRTRRPYLPLDEAHVSPERFYFRWQLPHVAGFPDLGVLPASLTSARSLVLLRRIVAERGIGRPMPTPHIHSVRSSSLRAAAKVSRTLTMGLAINLIESR